MTFTRITRFVAFLGLFFSMTSLEAGVFRHRSVFPSKPCQVRRTVSPVLRTGPEVSLVPENSLEGWTTLAGKEPGSAWTVENGVLHLKGRGGDIKTEREFKNFILDFEWTISKGGNSGIKYRFKHFEGKGWLGPEYQVLDDFNTKEGSKPKNSAATLYDILPTNDRKKLNPNDKMNRGRIVVNGNRLEHWLNGKKVVDVVVGSKEWKEAVENSKFNNIKGYGENSLGFIMVQDHQCEVWFHKISIREILDTKSTSQSVKSCAVARKTCGTKGMACKSVLRKKSCCVSTYCKQRCYKNRPLAAAPFRSFNCRRYR